MCRALSGSSSGWLAPPDPSLSSAISPSPAELDERGEPTTVSPACGRDARSEATKQRGCWSFEAPQLLSYGASVRGGGGI